MVPEGWQRGTYGDMLVETDERAGEGTDLPVLSVTKTRGPMLASERFGKVMHGRDLTKYRVARRNSIVADPMLLWDGSIGVQAVVDAGLVSPDYRVYAPTERARSDFLAHLVRSPHMLPHYQGGARGTNVRRNRIARSDFLAIPASLPPLVEQKKIAAILSSVDEAIESTRAVIEQVKDVKQAITAELLTHGLPGRHKARKFSAIGEIPLDWNLMTLGECLREPIRNGYSPVCPTTPTGRWVLHVGAVTFDGFNPRACKPAPTGDNRLDSATLEPGDLLVSRSNTRQRVGLAGVYRGVPGDCHYPDLLMRVRTSQRLDPDFLELVLLSPRVRSYLSSSARGTSESMVKIDRDILSSVAVPLPIRDEQRAIVGVVQTVAQRIEAEMEKLAGLHVLKEGLLRTLLTGEIRVTPTPEVP